MNVVTQGDDIFEILREAGVEVRRGGKMTCPHCGKRHVSASPSKGIAKCFTAGCTGFWSIHGDSAAPKAHWGTYVVSEIAAECQEFLPECQMALDWLESRGLPVGDPAWLLEQDLGAIPPDLDVPRIARETRRLFKEDCAERKERADTLVAKAKGAKAAGLAQASADELLASIDEEERQMEHVVGEILPALNTPLWRDAIVYIYRNSEFEPCSLNIRQPECEPEERRVIRVQPHQGRRGVFGALDADYQVGEAWGPGMPSLTVLEGEHNLLSLRAAFRRWGLKYFVPAVAVGGKCGADIHCIRDLSRSSEPLVVYDNDKIDPLTGRPGGYSLVDDISGAMYCAATTTSTKDLDDLLKARPRLSAKEFRADIIDRATPVAIKIETVRQRVIAALSEPGVETNSRQIRVTSVITDDVVKRTRLFNVDGYAMLLRQEDELRSQLIPVRNGDPFFQAFMQEFGVAKKEWVDAAGFALNVIAAQLSTPRKTVHSLAAWENGNLYINCYEGSMIRIGVVGENSIMTRVPIGTDGVLMQRFAADLEDTGAEVTPWLRPDADLNSIPLGSLRHRSNSVLEEYVLGRVEYLGASDDQKQLLKDWILCQFFAGSHWSRPVPMAEGVPGSGKTWLCARIGHTFLGSGFKVSNTPSNERELAELMTGVPFTVFDDWDTASKSVEGGFKRLSTGGTHKRRELYTTSKVVELSCDASVMVTTNANPLRQPGSSRRYLTFKIGARQKTPGEKVYQSEGDHLLPELMSMRSTLWEELLGDLCACVIGLHNSDPATKTSFSMADFGVFVQRIADHERWGSEAERMFICAEKTQDEQAADSQALVQNLRELLNSAPNLQDVFMFSRDWADRLQAVIPDYDQERKRMVNGRHVAWACKAYQDVFERQLDMRTEVDRHTKVLQYAFRLPACSTEAV